MISGFILPSCVDHTEGGGADGLNIVLIRKTTNYNKGEAYVRDKDKYTA